MLQQPCFSYIHIKLHKLHHGEKWRWERLHAWEAEAFGVGYRRNITFLPLSAPLTTASLGWDITTTAKETIICVYLTQWSVVSYTVFSTYSLNLMPIIHHSQLPLYFSTSHFPLSAHHYLQPPHAYLRSWSSSSASLNFLGPELMLGSEFTGGAVSHCMVCFSATWH